MPYDFTCPEIVVIYRLHAGDLQGFFVSTVCGSVWTSNARTELVRGPYDDFQNSSVSKQEPLKCVQDSSGYRTMPFAAYRSLCGDNIKRIIRKSVRARAPHNYLTGLFMGKTPGMHNFHPRAAVRCMVTLGFSHFWAVRFPKKKRQSHVIIALCHRLKQTLNS